MTPPSFAVRSLCALTLATLTSTALGQQIDDDDETEQPAILDLPFKARGFPSRSANPIHAMLPFK